MSIFDVIFWKIILLAIIAVTDAYKFCTNLSNVLYSLFSFIEFDVATDDVAFE